jgi:hypothetical protein
MTAHLKSQWASTLPIVLTQPDNCVPVHGIKESIKPLILQQAQVCWCLV